MKENWQASFDAMIVSEGGFVNHPDDPGGMTNLGVTKKVWEAWVGHPVTEAEMRVLTPELVAPLYKRRYWDACKCDEMPTGLDYLVFDFAVNAGPNRAAKTIQTAVGATADGAIGPITLAAIKKQDPAELIVNFGEAKEAFYRMLPTFPMFGRGWMNRVRHVQTAALQMVASNQT